MTCTEYAMKYTQDGKIPFGVKIKMLVVDLHELDEGAASEVGEIISKTLLKHFPTIVQASAILQITADVPTGEKSETEEEWLNRTGGDK